MAHVAFTHDTAPVPIDASLEAAGVTASGLGRPIRCRVQPDLYDWSETNYASWRGLSWTVECQDVAEGRRLREGLTQFFALFGGSAKTQEKLLAVLAEQGGRK